MSCTFWSKISDSNGRRILALASDQTGMSFRFCGVHVSSYAKTMQSHRRAHRLTRIMVWIPMQRLSRFRCDSRASAMSRSNTETFHVYKLRKNVEPDITIDDQGAHVKMREGGGMSSMLPRCSLPALTNLTWARYPFQKNL